MKKLLLTLGTTSAVLLPITSVIACSNNNNIVKDVKSDITNILNEKNGVQQLVNKLTGDLSIFNKADQSKLKAASDKLVEILNKDKDKIKKLTLIKNISAKTSLFKWDTIEVTLKSNTTSSSSPSPMPNSTSILDIHSPLAFSFAHVEGKLGAIIMDSTNAAENYMGITSMDRWAFVTASTGFKFTYTQVQNLKDSEFKTDPTNHRSYWAEVTNMLMHDKATGEMVFKENGKPDITPLVKDVTKEMLVKALNSKIKKLAEPLLMDFAKTNYSPLKATDISFKVVEYKIQNKTEKGISVTIKNYGPDKTIILKGFKQS